MTDDEGKVLYETDVIHIYGRENEEASMLKIRDLLVGRKIVYTSLKGSDWSTEGRVALDNGVELEIVGNDGCGGCPSGHYDLVKLEGVENAIMGVEFETDLDRDNQPRVLRLFVYAEGVESRQTLAVVDGDVGNGFYGSGYYVRVLTPMVSKY